MAHLDRTVVIMHRCFGLWHPDAPFLVSSNVVILDEPADVAFWVGDVSRRLGLGLHNNEMCAIVPFSMPPALSDVDRQLQEAHLAEARRSAASNINTPSSS